MRASRIGVVFRVAVALATGLLLCSVPLLGVWGVESALVLGLVMPWVVAVGAAHRAAVVARARAARVRDSDRADDLDSMDNPPWPTLAGVVARAAGWLMIPWACIALNMTRVRNCELGQGLAFHLLGPGMGVVLAAVSATALGAWLRRPRLAIAAAIALPCADIAWALARFWASPEIFFYGHTFGYFPGTFYDRGRSIELAYVWFRGLTLAWMVAWAWLYRVVRLQAVARHALRRARQATQTSVQSGVEMHAPTAASHPTMDSVWNMQRWISPSMWRAVRAGHVGQYRQIRLHALGGTLMVMMCAGVVALGHARGTELGIRSSAKWIQSRLGRTVQGRVCTVVVPRELRTEQARRLADDCDFRVNQAERMLQTRQRGRVTAYFFRSAQEKQRLMGAGDTYIAKPWRREVYLQLESWPHSVLAHEVAHVVAGNVARGPFRVAGRFGGWWPNPALIEGVAVAVAWQSMRALAPQGRGGRSPHESAKALVVLGKAPSLESVFGMRFIAHASDRAYTIAGSVLRYLLDRDGPAPLAAAYRTGDVQSAYGQSLKAIEREWRAFLARDVSLPAAELELARARFVERPVFTDVCPHYVEALQEKLLQSVSIAEWARVQQWCDELLRVRPGDATAGVYHVASWAMRGDQVRAERALRDLRATAGATQVVVDRAREWMADAAWLQGRVADARPLYQSLLTRPQSEDALRRLEAKVASLQSNSQVSAAALGLLVRATSEPVSGAVAMYWAGQIAQGRGDGLGPYLQARMLYQDERFDEAAEHLGEALARGLPAKTLQAEAERLHRMALFGAGRHPQACELWRLVRGSEPEAPQSSESGVGPLLERREWLDRCAFHGISAPGP